MPVTTVVANSLTLSVGDAGFAVDAECQVINLNFTAPGPGEPTVVFVACPDSAIAEPGDAVKGVIGGEVAADYSTTGISRMLIEHQGETVDYTLVQNPDVAGQKVTWTGECLIPPFEFTWEPRKTERHTLNLSVITAVPSFA